MARQAAIITLSDGAFHGDRQDLSGQALKELLEVNGFDVLHQEILPDEREQIARVLLNLCDNPAVRLIVTTGGTGLGPRDVTPEATMDVIERTIPGMAEAMRAESFKKTPFAMTSRQVVGARGNKLIVNFPGSPKAVRECFAVIQPVLQHVLDLLEGNTAHGSPEH